MERPNVSKQRFLIVTLLNVLITVVEIIGGVVSGSLALLSDAFHNLGDSISIVLGYFAQVISGRPENRRRTYGYRRAEILSAMANSIFLIVVSIALIVEAVKRFSHPEHINGRIMLIVAIIGLLANLVSAQLLHSGSHDSLNVKATYLHVLSDALSSIAVIFGGVILMFFNITWLDPTLTILVALYIAKEALPTIKHDLMQVPGVVGVHHVHAWTIDEHRIVFSAHLNCHDMMLSEVEKIYLQVEKILNDKYDIKHVTLQAECQRGRDEELFNPPVDHDKLC